jgi:SET and MYND domain-containing protein
MTLVSATFDQLGLTFDPALALLNHSCNPNAAIVFDRNIASLRSIRDIAEAEQITISYIDNTFKTGDTKTTTPRPVFLPMPLFGLRTT